MTGDPTGARGAFGDLLRLHRSIANLTQEELAERSNVSVDAIGMLERGVRRSPRPSTVNRLADALRLDTAARQVFVEAARGQPVVDANRVPPTHGQLHDAEDLFASMPADVLPPRAPLPVGSRMPLAPNPLFVGRTEELLRIAARFRDGDTSPALGNTVASTGLGGLGKTQLAVEFVHRYGRFFEGGVFWLSFASAQEVPIQVAAYAGTGPTGLEAAAGSLSMEGRLRLVTSAWRSPIPRLLVFDNCDDEALLEVWRPTSGGCRVLITSRRSHWSPTLGVVVLPLEPLPRQDSIDLLRRYRPDLAHRDRRLEAIAFELGDLPLALHLAGSHLRAYGADVGVGDYLAELRRSAVLRHASLLGAGLDGVPSPTHHVHSLAQTFALSLCRLDRRRRTDRVAVALLARMACLAPGEAIPRDLLWKTLPDLDPRQRVDGLRRLGAIGLVEEGDGWLRMHRLLVHFVRQEGLDPSAHTAVIQTLLECRDAAYVGHLSGPALAAVIPHLVHAASTGADADPTRAGLCATAGVALARAGDVHAGRPWLEQAVQIRDRVLGGEHPDTAQSLTDLGGLLREEGQFAAARPLLERALDINERMLGPGHPATIESRNQLGGTLWSHGELTAAKLLYERSLAINEAVHGPDHREVAANLNNLGLVLRDQGELSASRPLFERAVAIYERTLGPDHAYTALALNNLALVLRAQGMFDEARTLYERALAIQERALGSDHPDYARTLNNLGRVLQARGELSAASSLYHRAAAIQERLLGPDHPDTARSLNNLGTLLHRQGELAAATLLLERALSIRERALAPDHPDTASSLQSLAVLVGEQGCVALASDLFARALAIRERVLGAEHPSTVESRVALERLAGEPVDHLEEP